MCSPVSQRLKGQHRDKCCTALIEWQVTDNIIRYTKRNICLIGGLHSMTVLVSVCARVCACVFVRLRVREVVSPRDQQMGPLVYQIVRDWNRSSQQFILNWLHTQLGDVHQCSLKNAQNKTFYFKHKRNVLVFATIILIIYKSISKHKEITKKMDYVDYSEC